MPGGPLSRVGSGQCGAARRGTLEYTCIHTDSVPSHEHTCQYVLRVPAREQRLQYPQVLDRVAVWAAQRS